MRQSFGSKMAPTRYGLSMLISYQTLGPSMFLRLFALRMRREGHWAAEAVATEESVTRVPGRLRHKRQLNASS